MGQGSRGGKDGVSSSGSRERSDKEAKKAAEEPKKVGEGGKKSDGGGGGMNGRGLGRGLRGLGRLGRDLSKLKPKTSSGSKPYTKSAGSKSVPTSSVTSSKGNRLQPIKGPGVKLTKAPTNKTPN